MYKSIEKITLPSTRMIQEGSFGANDIGAHCSTMELFIDDASPKHGRIEWDIPSIGDTEQIGLYWDEQRRLLDYDGVASLPREAIELLGKHGITVGPDFR